MYRVKALKKIGLWVDVGELTFLSEQDALRYEKKGFVQILEHVTKDHFALLKVLAKYGKILKGYKGVPLDKKLFAYLVQDVIKEYKSGGNPLRDEVAKQDLFRK